MDTIALPAGWMPALAGAAGVIAFVAVVAAARAMFSGKDEVVERLGRTATIREPGAGADDRGSAFTATLSRVLRPLARIVRPSRSEEMSRLRRNLLRAGYRGENATEIFLGTKLILAPAATLGWLQVNGRLASPAVFPMDMVVAAWLCGLAFFFPNLWLRGKITERQTSIERALPDAMDLLVTCVESGLGLDAAIDRVAAEVKLAAPILGEEMELTFLEIQAGIPRADAFRRLADRTGVEELRQLSAMLIQTEMFGTSVARALRVHADGMRIKRMQRAEEKAAMVAVKLTVPLVLLILPSLMAVVMGPAVVSIARAFADK